MSVPAYLLNDTTTKAEPQAKPDVFVPNSEFYPAINLREFEAAHQVDDSYSENRRLSKLANAIRETNEELTDQRCKWVRKGYFTLESVPQEDYAATAPTAEDPQAVRTESVLLLTYKTAVFAKAMQLLNERYRATDTKAYAVPKAEVMEEVALNYEEQFRRAIYSLTGREGSSICVEIL